jgi:hypothetical protein
MKSLAIVVALAGVAHADAKAVVDAQVAGMTNGDRDNGFFATLAPDAVFVNAALDAPARGTKALESAVGGLLSPMSTHFTKVTIDKLTTGGDAKATWVVAELTTTFWYPEWPKPTTEPMRLVELLVPDPKGALRALVVMATRPKNVSSHVFDPYPAIEGASTPGALSALLVAPGKLDAAMAKDGVVLGTDGSERAIGGAKTHALLAGWTKLKLSLDGDSFEVHTKTYGFALANLGLAGGKNGNHFRGLILALPKGDGWTVVAVDYAYGMNY